MTGTVVHAIGFVAGAVTGSVFTYRRVARLANDIIVDVERQAQLRLDRARAGYVTAVLTTLDTDGDRGHRRTPTARCAERPT